MVEESYLPLTLTVPGLTDSQFQEFCEQYADYRLEYTAEGELIIMPPTDFGTGVRNSSINRQLGNWALSVKRGFVTDSSSGFTLPNGARRSPDAAWTSRERSRIRPMCPEFVVELLSPSDRPKQVRAKMMEWISNGAELGWMINPRTHTVTIFRPGQEPEVLTGIAEVAGEGPVAGFVLDLTSIWDPI